MNEPTTHLIIYLQEFLKEFATREIVPNQFEMLKLLYLYKGVHTFAAFQMAEDLAVQSGMSIEELTRLVELNKKIQEYAISYDNKPSYMRARILFHFYKLHSDYHGAA